MSNLFDGGLTPQDNHIGYYHYEFVLDPISAKPGRPGNRQYMPIKWQTEIGITLMQVLKSHRRLLQETVARMSPKDPQYRAFELAIRKAYARERYFRRYIRSHGKPR